MKPFFISIPHAGEKLVPETPWLNALPEPVLMCDVDRYVDQLYLPAIQKLEIPSVIAEIHRYVVDLNRLPGDIDRDTVEDSQNPSGKFAWGFHWLETTRGDRILPKPLSRKLHEDISTRYYEPFHQKIRNQYADYFAKGEKNVYHIDAHSMPSQGTKGHRDPGQTRADVVISDSDGKSCRPEFKDLVIESFKDNGFQVAYNWPYKGGRVTETYGRPELGQQALQIELNRSLYMDETSKQKKPGAFEDLKDRLLKVVEHIVRNLP